MTSISALVKGLDIILPAGTAGERARLNLAQCNKKGADRVIAHSANAWFD